MIIPSPLLLSPVTIKWEVRLTSPSPKSNYLTFLSSVTLPTHMTYQLVIVISIHYQCAPYFHQSPQSLPMLMFTFKIPHTYIYPFRVNFGAHIAMLAPMIRIVWLIRTLPVTTSGKELVQLIILEYPRLRMLFSPFLKHHTSLSPRMVALKIPSLNSTEFQDSLHEFIQSPSIEDNVLRIGDCDPFDEMSSHDNDSGPNLSECNLFDDHSSSPTERFQDVIELGQCKIFDSTLAKDFVLTLGECNIFDGSPSDDSCTGLLLGECKIFTEEPCGHSNADMMTLFLDLENLCHFLLRTHPPLVKPLFPLRVDITLSWMQVQLPLHCP